jgi:hypothetical protein
MTGAARPPRPPFVHAARDESLDPADFRIGAGSLGPGTRPRLRTLRL